tara:strand:+ start:3977 stop:4888 length:912 start_codon:yes stop_codon:yes gene_type:complete
MSNKFKILIVILFTSFGGFSVNHLNKVETLFKAGKYKQAYKKAYKLKGEPAYYKKPKTYFYLGFSMLNLSKEATNKLGVYNREKTIVSYVLKGIKYQKSEKDLQRFELFFTPFINAAKNRVGIAKKARKEKEWKNITNILADHFSDTLSEYWEIHPKKESNGKENFTSVSWIKNSSIPSRSDSIIKWAKTYIGTPYKYGGESRKGIDCSGFTLTILNQFGAQLPHSSKLQAQRGEKVKRYKVGDLAFFGHKKGNINHVAIIISNYPAPLKVIHATSSKGVMEDDVEKSSYWKPRYLYAVRVLN